MLLNNVAFLATDINTSKCYLQALFEQNMFPAEIIYVQINKKPGLRFYKQRFKSIVKNILKPKSKQPVNRPPISESEQAAIEKQLEKEVNAYLTKKQLPLVDYSSSTPDILSENGIAFNQIKVQSINDPKLVNYLNSKVISEFVIFSGGGILRKNMLNSKRFIHVHPGVVPDIKGAHCFLWSALVKDKIGMSAFFMNEGIDTGDIIETIEYEKPRLKLQAWEKLIRPVGKYLINHLDPSYRADLLTSLFKKEPDPAKWPTRKQKPSEGKTYYFMHNEIMEMALQKLTI